jgi:hypothetical protein
VRGCLHVGWRGTPFFARTSNRYRLAVDTPADKLSGGTRATVAVGGGQQRPGAPDTHVLGTITEPSIEPSLQPPPSRHQMSSLFPRNGGGDLWYPTNLTPAQRDVLSERLAGLTPDQAQQILDELSGRLAIAQVRNPLRYCAVLIKRVLF